MSSQERTQGEHSGFPLIAKVLIWRQLLWGAAFYGTYVLITKYFLNELNYSEADTLMMMGAFGAVGPVFSAIGGFVADRYIGSYRAVYIGYTVYTVGFALLGIGASMVSIPLSIFAIALIGYSRGLSATSPTVLLGNAFGRGRDMAFQQGLTVNYAINNFGSFLSQYLFPFMIAYVAYTGNFFISSVLMVLTLVLFFVYHKRLVETGNHLDKQSVSARVWLGFFLGSVLMLGLVYWIFANLEAGKYFLYSLGCIAILYFVVETFRESPEYRYKMSAVLITILILIGFYFYYGQMVTAMNLYSINLMGGHLFGFIPVRPESNLAFNPLWCCIMGGPLVAVYAWLEKHHISPSIPAKFGVAMIFCAMAFGVLALSTQFVGADGKVAADWVLWANFLQSTAELIVGALGAGYIFQLVPERMSAFAIGLRSVALSLSGILAASMSTSIALPKGQIITQTVIDAVYAGYFFKLAVMALVMAVLTFILARIITRLVKKGENIKDASGRVQHATANAH
ncbi:Dipeptide and tripeptide permease A [invertebrate metagenome]|uniref:Dipeptide and tripeptide permease A n=1 Tax=invertebrate metagenome TaxID=1711999 RepID=A0A2H9T9Y8_9ZZZZ